MPSVAVCFAAVMRAEYSGICFAAAKRVVYSGLPYTAVIYCKYYKNYVRSYPYGFECLDCSALRNQDTGVFDRSRHGV